MAQTDMQPPGLSHSPGKDADHLDPQVALNLAVMEAELVQVYAQASSAWASIDVPRDVSPFGCEAKRA
jgi:hypothetical protein